MNQPKNQTVLAEVLSTRMLMRCRTEDGTIINLPGTLPAGSTVAVQATGVLTDGTVLGYEGYSVEVKAPSKRSRAEALADSLSRVGSPA